ncbi:MAG: class I SAM-dependent methyltransferase [Mariprofundaceae bacterium]|nr:class I SAM-dependent methyltransferase [Mariprofundaceae bacterium]
MMQLTLSFKSIIKKIRSICSFYIANRTLNHLQNIREYELDMVIDFLPSEGRLLEIGAGTGWQADRLSSLGYNVSAIDIESSNYMESRIYPVLDYDGEKLPFNDNEFDIIFSSNVLEHIPHIYEFQNEIHRVLKPNGIVLHVLPSSSWRFWSNISEMLRTWKLPQVHGEHAKNAISEIYYFSRWRWSRLFYEASWNIECVSSNRLFYTGSSIMDSRLSISVRKSLSYVLGGGACNIFVLRGKAE